VNVDAKNIAHLIQFDLSSVYFKCGIHTEWFAFISNGSSIVSPYVLFASTFFLYSNFIALLQKN